MSNRRPSSHVPLRRAGRRLTTLLLAVVAVLGTLVPAVTAQGDAVTREELGLELSVGFGGVAPHRASWTPVEVALEPTRVTAGTLSVTANAGGASTVESREVEVAAGARKVYRFVVPPADDLIVSFVAPERTPLSLRANLAPDGPAYAVGLLDRDPPRGAPPVVAYGSELRGTYARVDSAWLDRSARAFEELGTLVADVATLEALGEVARANLVAAVANGLELVIEVPAGATPDLVALGLPWNPVTGATSSAVQVVRATNATPVAETVSVLEPAPDAWPMTAGDVLPGSDEAVVVSAVTAGRGRVAVSGAVLGEGVLGTSGEVWQHLLQPSVSLSDGLGDSGRELFVAQQAVRDPSLSVPNIPGLTLFLIAFVLLVGPVNGFVLGRLQRRELAWVTVPAITVVFAAVAFVGATRTAPATGLAGTATWWVDGVGSQLQATVVRAPNPGAHEVRLAGEGWDVRNGSFGRPATVDRSGGDVAIRFQLEALELGTLLATRPTDASAPLTVVPEVTADGITATITNTSDVTVSDVWVRVATARRRVGQLAPGASETLTVTGSTDSLPVVNAWMDQFEGMRDEQGVAEAPRALEEFLRWNVLDASPGTVWVTGTIASAAGLAALPLADGTTPTDIGGVVAVGAALRGDAAAATPFGVQRTLVAQSRFGSLYRPSPTAVEGQGEVVLRYRLPRVSSVGEIVASLDRGMLQNDGGGFRGPEGPLECFTRPVLNPTTDTEVQQEVCIEAGVPEQDGDCPPDATSCFISRFRIEVCTGDPNRGMTCSESFIDDPGQAGGGGLEVFDRIAGVWVPTALAFPDGTGDAGPYVSPLGEVHLRMSGQFHPFDFSGRGIALTTAGGSA